MNSTRHNPIVRLMPSFTDLAFLLPLVFMFTRMDGVAGMLGDGDTGWHVRAGDWMRANGRVPHEDIFSFTMPGKPWYAWEWLWDVAFSWLHTEWGMSAVVLVSMLVICLTFALLFRLAQRMCGHALVAIGLTVMAAAASTIHWLARPHLFTMLFLVILLGVVERARRENLKLLYWLPLLTVFWVNIHGGFLAGVVVLGAYGAGDLVQAALVSENRRLSIRRGLTFLATAAACMVASLVNPYGYQLHLHIWEYLTEPGMTEAIVEFQGTNFQSAASGYLEGLLALGFGAAIWYARKGRFAEVFVLAGWGHLSMLVARNIPLFAIVATPLIAPAVTAWLTALETAPVAAWARKIARELLEFGQELQPMEAISRVHLVSAAGLALVALGMMEPANGRLWRSEYDPKSYPAAALAKLNVSQRIFTNDEWGDYLIYKLWPQGGKVYVDGRSDFYGTKFNREYIELMRGRFDWEKTLSNYGVDTVLLSAQSGFAATLKESEHWHVVFDDGIAIVFQRAGTVETRGTSPSPKGAGAGIGFTTDSPKHVTLGGHDSHPIGVKPI